MQLKRRARRSSQLMMVSDWLELARNMAKKGWGVGGHLQGDRIGDWSRRHSGKFKYIFYMHFVDFLRFAVV